MVFTPFFTELACTISDNRVLTAFFPPKSIQVHGGSPQNLKLLTMLAPDAVIALKNADFEEKGPLASYTKQGDVATMRVDMAKIGALADTQLYEPEPGQPIHVML